jgi:hypothetical protein
LTDVGGWTKNARIQFVPSLEICLGPVGQKLVVNLSRGSMAGMLAMYAIILAAGTQQADWEALTLGDWSQTPSTAPILLLTLVSLPQR